MTNKRRVEVFSAGCALCEEVVDAVRREAGPSCEEVVDAVRREAGPSCEVVVRNMLDSRVLRPAEELGIRSVPAVVIDGKFVSGSAAFFQFGNTLACCDGSR
jgi:glutaredoxin 3